MVQKQMQHVLLVQKTISCKDNHFFLSIFLSSSLYASVPSCFQAIRPTHTCECHVWEHQEGICFYLNLMQIFLHGLTDDLVSIWWSNVADTPIIHMLIMKMHTCNRTTFNPLTPESRPRQKKENPPQDHLLTCS